MNEKCGFIFDMDGTLYLEEQVIDGALELLYELEQRKIPFCLVTNNSSCSRSVYQKKLSRLGFDVGIEKILTSGFATILDLKKNQISRVFLLGTPELHEEFQSFGIDSESEDPQAVILSFDKTLDYQKLQKAHEWILDGIEFIATHPDLVCPVKGGSIPDCGAMIELLRASTGKSPRIIGKPYPGLARMAAAYLQLELDRVFVVGDRLYTDMQMGFDSGCKTILVLSGEAREEGITGRKPDYIFASVKTILERINGDLCL